MLLSSVYFVCLYVGLFIRLRYKEYAVHQLPNSYDSENKKIMLNVKYVYKNIKINMNKIPLNVISQHGKISVFPSNTQTNTQKCIAVLYYV